MDPDDILKPVVLRDRWREPVTSLESLKLQRKAVDLETGASHLGLDQVLSSRLAAHRGGLLNQFRSEVELIIEAIGNGSFDGLDDFFCEHAPNLTHGHFSAALRHHKGWDRRTPNPHTFTRHL